MNDKIQAAAVPAIEKSAKRIPRMAKRALDLILHGKAKTITEAAEQLGTAREYVSRILNRPDVMDYREKRVRSALANATGPAAARLMELLHAKSEHVSLDAANSVLAIANIRPPQQAPSVNILNNIQPGYVIRLDPGHSDATRDARSITTDAGGVIYDGPIIEHLEDGK